MKPRHLAGILSIAAVFATTGWLVHVSPSYQSTLRAATLDRPTAISCVWSQPWADPAFVMDGWSQPQSWWHEPATKVLWSNAHTAQIMFHLASGHASGVDLGIKYPAISTDVEVLVNGKRAGTLDRSANGNEEPHVFRYRLSPLPDDGIVDLRFLVRDAALHLDDGRYLGVLLQAIRACPTD